MTRIALKAAAFALGLGITLPAWAQSTPVSQFAPTQTIDWPTHATGGAVRLYDINGNVIGGATHPIMVQCPDGTTNCFGGSGGGGAVTPGVGAAGIANSNAAGPFATQLMVSDNSNFQRVLAPIILGDGVNGNNMLSDGIWGWNGTSWDKVRTDTTAGLWTQVKAALPAGTAIIGKVGTDQTTPGTTDLVHAAQNGTWTVQPGNTANTTAWKVDGSAVTQPVSIAPSSASGAGVAPTVSTAAESNHVLKSGAGNLYTLTATIGASTGYVMLFDATSAPADGAVTPKFCKPILSNGTLGGASYSWSPGPPLNFTQGITAVFSTTGCFTKTASATAAFFAQVQ